MNSPATTPSKASMLRNRAPLITAALAVLLMAAVATPALALRRGARAPEIGLRDLSGNRVQLSALRGKVVIVDFWASWCAPCRQELPVLERLYQRYREQGLVVVGVNIDNEASNMRRFLRRVNVSFPIVHDGGHAVAGRYSPPTMPTSYVVDRNGVIRHIHQGFRASDAAGLEREIQALLR